MNRNPLASAVIATLSQEPPCMYYVIDAKSIPSVATSDEARALCASLAVNNTTGDWRVVIEQRADERLERLYALTDFLLRGSKMNPLVLQLTVSEANYSAARIMQEAREWIDA